MGTIVTSMDEVSNHLGITPTDAQAAVIMNAISLAEASVKSYLRYDPVQRTRTEFYNRENLNDNSRDFIWNARGSQAVLEASGSTSLVIALKHLPVRSVVSVKVDSDGRSGTAPDAFGSDTEKVEGTDFWPNYDGRDDSGNLICRDGLLRSYGLWPSGAGSIEIQYVAGYTAEEFAGTAGIVDASAIYGVILEEAARIAKGTFLAQSQGTVGFIAGTFESEKLGDYEYEIGTSTGQGGSTSDRLFGGVTALLPTSAQRLSEFVNWSLVN